jgi:ferredoxin-NADP reductase
MAIARSARVVSAENVGPDTRLLELFAPEPLGFVGGQYVIIDSGLFLESGKAVKRAYSLLSPDSEQRRFQIAVKRICGGRGSAFVHELGVGAEIRFSGPWGRLFPQSGARGSTLVLATDTGISAALGLVQSVRFAPLLAGAVFVWLRTSPGYFLPDAFVRQCVPAACRDLRIELIQAIGDPERIDHARDVFRRVVAERALEQAFVSGDGAVNYALLDELVAAGIRATKDNVESFFNMPKKSAPALVGA